MKVLNLYSGIGGNRKLWEDVEVTAVELNPEIAEVYQDNFPDDKMIIGDAHKYLLDHYKEFDFIWSSPPCPTHSKMVKATRHDIVVYPDMRLYEEIIFLNHFFKGLWLVENVDPYYTPLLPPTKKLGRHLFWGNFRIGDFEIPNIKGFIQRGSKKDLEIMKDRLGIYFNDPIYINGNHDPGQVLRNCVLPETGLYILDCARGIIRKKNQKQLEMF